MKRLLLIIGLIVGASFSPAYAANTGLCFTTNGSNCIPVGTQPSSGAAWGPLPVTISGASFTATTAATATASAPSYSEGQVAPISQDLSGNLRTAATLTFPSIGSAVPSTGIYNGINVGGTLRGVTGLSLGSTYSQTMAIVDGSGNQITTFGGTITNWGSGSNTLGAMANYGTSPGAVKVPGVNAFVTNTNANGSATSANSSPVVIASDQAVIPTSPSAATTGGTTQYSLIAANSTNSTLISTGAHVVYSIQTGNISATVPAYLKLYDKATAPTCGTDTPTKVLVIPANSLGAGNNVSIPVGAGFILGLGICVTAGIANNDTTAVAAATVIANLGYK